MSKTDLNTKQAILKAAEEEFLNKGFDRTKTTEIARKVGVNHAMLHYYFRTKENLFNVVFEKKVHILASSLAVTFDSDLPFLEKLKNAIETHFDFLTTNPRLPFFVYNEIICNEKRKHFFIETVLPKVGSMLSKLDEDIKTEIERGTIMTMTAVDLLFNILSLNLYPFLVQPLIQMLDEDTKTEYDLFLQKRKENNVHIILKSLQP